MTSPVTPQDYATFLESLRVTEDGPAEMHGWRFDAPLDSWSGDVVLQGEDPSEILEKVSQYFQERCRRAELNRKPPTLLEDVKACMRAGMDLASKQVPAGYAFYKEHFKELETFRKLSEAGDTRPIARINKPTKLEPIFGDSEAGDK